MQRNNRGIENYLPETFYVWLPPPHFSLVPTLYIYKVAFLISFGSNVTELNN